MVPSCTGIQPLNNGTDITKYTGVHQSCKIQFKYSYTQKNAYNTILTANHHDDDAIDLFVGRVGRDVAKPHRGEGGEREIQ